jgi:hypothetical protein
MSAPFTARRAARLAAIGALVLVLPACNAAQRMSNIGTGPELSKIEDPQAKPGADAVGAQSQLAVAQRLAGVLQ